MARKKTLKKIFFIKMLREILLIFSKVPVSGLVKTRLNQNTCLSISDTTLIAEAMLKDTISLSSKSLAGQIYLGYIPEEYLPLLKDIVEDVRNDGQLDKPIHYILQKGTNFDERFGSVVNDTFSKGAEKIVILGADLPYLDPALINIAFKSLSSETINKRIVIGPSNGGGIYLVGINQNFNYKWFQKYQLFRGGVEIIQFSDFCKNKGIDLVVLPAFGDIDLEEDLVSLIAYIEVLSISKSYSGFFYPYYTAKIIDDLGLYIENIQDNTRKRKLRKK